MKRDWNARARLCAPEYILTGFGDLDPEEFAATGLHDAATLLPYLRPTDVVLDLGCGIGRVSRELQHHVREIHAVDVSEEMIRQARAYVGPTSKIHFHINDGSSLPNLADQSIDFAFSLLTMHHVVRSAFHSYLSEVHRILRPGGRFWFSVISRDRSPSYEVDEAHDTFTGRAYSDAEIEELLRGRWEQLERWFIESGEGNWRVTYLCLVIRKLATAER
jgi:ubiquinone/menaquinone biosynthesis C-methylase UbiE